MTPEDLDGLDTEERAAVKVLAGKGWILIKMDDELMQRIGARSEALGMIPGEFVVKAVRSVLDVAEQMDAQVPPGTTTH
jgi:hypothetical protein